MLWAFSTWPMGEETPKESCMTGAVLVVLANSEEEAWKNLSQALSNDMEIKKQISDFSPDNFVLISKNVDHFFTLIDYL